MRSIAHFRCVMPEPFPGLLMSWIRGTPSLPESLIIGPRILLCHFLWRRTCRGSSSSLRRSRSISGPAARDPSTYLSKLLSFCTPILSSADVVQHTLDFVVA